MTTQLYVDGQQVVLPKEFKIKLIKENPYFTKSATYTRDIKLSLNSLVNKRIFKNLNRIEVTKKATSWPARLKVGQVVDISGRVVLREVKIDQVNLMFVADNAELNFLGKQGDAYIDELEYDNSKRVEYPLGTKYSEFNREEQTMLWGAYGAMGKNYKGEQKPVEWIFTPVKSASDNQLKNKLVAILGWRDGEIRGYTNFAFPPTRTHQEFLSSKSPQPYFIYALKTVLSKFGYELHFNEKDFPIFENLIICHSSVFVRNLNDVLPHWTLNELLTEVENFLNVVFLKKGNTLEMLPAASFYEDVASTTSLKVIDEYTTTIEDNSGENDISSANLSYDLREVVDLERVDDSLIHSLHKVVATTMNELESKKNAIPIEERYSYLYICGNRHFMLKHGTGHTTRPDATGDHFKEFNQLRDLTRDKENENVTSLKIVPAPLISQEVEVNERPITIGKRWTAKVYIPYVDGVPNLAPSEGEETPADLETILNSEAHTEFKKDLIEVALADVQKGKDGFGYVYTDNLMRRRADYPVTYYDYRKGQPEYPYPLYKCREEKSLRLHASDSDKLSIGSLHDTSINIDRQVEHKFRFIAKTIPNVRDLFLIRNQEYVAKSIEVEIKPDGINPVQQIILHKKLEN